MAKKSTSDVNLLKIPLTALKILGRHPLTTSLYRNVTAGFYLIILFYLFITTAFQYKNINGNVYKFANNFEGSTAYIQISGKVIFTITHKNQLLELIDGVKLFWSIEKCTILNVKTNIKNALLHTELILKIFFVCFGATEILIVMAPIFTKDLAVGAWTVENADTWFKCTLLVQECFLFFILTTFTFIIDCLFLVLFIYVLVQFKVLNACIRSLKVPNELNEKNKNEYVKSLKICLDYHIFLLRYLEQLRKTASPILLIEYMTTAVLFCTEMYMFIESTNIQESIRRPVSFCAVLFQLSFYCIPADYVISEAMEVSDALYESDWTSTYISETSKTISIIIQRSQRPIIFSAGGLVDINSKTLINVVKISWSVCTILRGLKTKQM